MMRMIRKKILKMGMRLLRKYKSKMVRGLILDRVLNTGETHRLHICNKKETQNRRRQRQHHQVL